MSTTFAAGVAQWKSRVEKRLAAVTNDTVYEVAKRLVARTPVASGHLVSNWQLSIDTIIEGEVQGQDPTGSKTLSRIRAGLLAVDYFKPHVFYVINTAHYASVIEFGHFPNPPKAGTGKTVGGFSTQAPAGMVGLTQLEFPQIVAEVTASVSASGDTL